MNLNLIIQNLIEMFMEFDYTKGVVNDSKRFGTIKILWW